MNIKENVLFIAEKPSVAKAIAMAYTDRPMQKNGYIDCGNNVLITWCYGHMYRLKTPQDHDKSITRWKLSDLPYNMLKKPVYVVGNDKKEQVRVINDLLHKFENVVHAGDPDDEGQRIVDSVIEKSKSTPKNIKRLWLNDNNKEVVIKELSRIKSNDDFKGYSNRALARAVVDQIYGFNLTVAYSVKNGFLLNVGRVSTAILGLIANREILNKGHIESYYYNLYGTFSFNETPIVAKLINVSKDYLNSNGNIINENYLKEVLEKCKANIAIIDEYESKVVEQAPPLTYNLLKLQSDCSKLYEIPPQKTLEITQQLREEHGLITYNRTDSQYLNDEHHEEAKDILPLILNNLGVDYQVDSTMKSRVFNSKKTTAHHAIIPTKTAINKPLTSDQEKVYKLIANRYVMQFMPLRKVLKNQVKIKVESFIFSATSSKELESGWKELDVTFSESKKDDEIDLIPELEVGQGGACNNLEIKKSKTAPPRLYTTDTLLSDLTRVAQYIENPELKKVLIDKDKGSEGENGGIGTPATRGAIIDTLFKNEFLQYKNKNIITTDKGMRFFQILPKELSSIDISAIWEIELQKIENGEINYQDFIDSVNERVEKWVKFIVSESEYHDENADKCKSCNAGIMKLKVSGKSTFFGCTNYPECKQTYPVNKDGKPDYDYKPATITEHKCKKCNSGLILRKSKTNFFGCSAYPECKQTYPVNDDGKPNYDFVPFKKTEHKCNECNNDLVLRNGKYGKFFSCSTYPVCKSSYKIDTDGNPIYF